MDEIDQSILKILKENSRKSYTEIADNLEVSEGTVRNRVKKMKEEEIIEKFTVELSENSFKAVAMFEVSVDADIRSLIEEFPEDMEINEVTGEFDIVVVFARESPEKINSVLDNIREMEGIESSKTYTVLKTTKK
ncbi:MAG: Lrp/AsnC family transcriptional regulator [Candidatus Nanohaloarchaea archaeon]